MNLMVESVFTFCISVGSLLMALIPQNTGNESVFLAISLFYGVTFFRRLEQIKVFHNTKIPDHLRLHCA
jgi:hypothetical protein